MKELPRTKALASTIVAMRMHSSQELQLIPLDSTFAAHKLVSWEPHLSGELRFKQ